MSSTRSRPPVDRVSWYDVWNWARELEATWHCYIEFQQWPVRKEGFGGKWDIRCVARWLGVGGKVTREEGVSAIYPQNGTGSLPGAQLKLLLDLDVKLEQLQREEKNGASAQTRFAI